MDTRGIAEGMAVRASDGKKLGSVIECAEGTFVVEKGLFFPKDFTIRYEQVAEVRDGEVYLNVADLDLGETAGPPPDTAGEAPVTASPSGVAAGGTLGGAGLGAAGTPAGAGIGAGLGAIADAVRDEPRDEEIRKRPVVTEEVLAGRTHREEERRADVEVRREEARIEGTDETRNVEGPPEPERRADYPRSDFDDPERR